MSEKASTRLPPKSPDDTDQHRLAPRPRTTKTSVLVSLLSVVIAGAFVLLSVLLSSFSGPLSITSPHFHSRHATFNGPTFNISRASVLARCAALKTIPGPPPDFWGRDESERFEPGTNATLIRNAVIFTGKDNGSDIVRGDLLLDKGVVRQVGDDLSYLIEEYRGGRNLTIVDADGAWVTPGLGALFFRSADV